MILYEEDCQRKGCTVETMISSFQAKGSTKDHGKLDSDKECYNCHKKGHIVKDCWTKGGVVKERVQKDEDQERAVTDQIRHQKQQTGSYLMHHTWQI